MPSSHTITSVQNKYIFRVLKKDAEHVESILADSQPVAEKTLKEKYPDSEILFLWEKKTHSTKSSNPSTKFIIILFFFSALFALAGLLLLYMRMREEKYLFYISIAFALAATFRWLYDKVKQK
jgi:ADP-heptose:LPS heptosyltransferase